jgi:cation diffusion facilitator family transporter
MDKNAKLLERKKITSREGWISILVNLVLFVVKYWAGVVSGSLALIADAWHTLSDSISSVFVIISAKIAFKQPDKDHPFGHGRYELVTSIVIGILLVLIGANFVREGILKLMEREEASYGTIALIVTIISLIGKELLAQYALWGYRKTKSETLKADAWHHRSDALSSVVLLIGIIVGKHFWWSDGILSILIAGFILYAAYEIISKSIHRLLGENVSADFVEELAKVSNEVAGHDVFMHHVHIHNYILHKELTFHICLPPELTISEAHNKVDKIEKEILKRYEIECTIHVDPYIKP